MTISIGQRLKRLQAAAAIAASLALASTASAQYGGYYDDDYGDDYNQDYGYYDTGLYDDYDYGYYDGGYGYDQDYGYGQTYYSRYPYGDPGYIGLYEEDLAWDDPRAEADDAWSSPDYRWGYYDPQEREGYPMYWWNEDTQEWVRSTGEDAWTGVGTTGARDQYDTRARYYDIDMYVIDPRTGERRRRTDTGGMQQDQQRMRQQQQYQYQDRQSAPQDQQRSRQMQTGRTGREDTVGGRNSSMQMDQMRRQRMMQDRQMQGGQQGQMMRQQGRQSPAGQANLRGEIADTREVSLRNNQGQRRNTTLLRVELQSGRSEIVDIGPRYSVQDLNLGEGDQITVTGQRQTINGRPIIKAQTISVEGQRFNVRETRPGSGQQQYQNQQRYPNQRNR